ncbi:MAG: ABC transporter permease [Coxiellaceae bacterium]|nr:ABC transporter permease [Coxiellaceae bacterium]
MMSVMSESLQHLYQLPLTLANYHEILSPIYFHVFIRTLLIAGLATLLCLLISYPFAYFIAATRKNTQAILLLFVIVPFWTSSLIRTYAIMALLKAKGLINTALLSLGIIDQPLQMLYTNTALLIGLVYTLIPFMILPLYTNMARLDKRIIEAARDLGANNRTVFLKIILPMTKPGMLSGSILVFLPAMTLFYLPALLGGSKSMLLGNLIQNQFMGAMNWPLGATSSTVLIAIMLVVVAYYWTHTQSKDRRDLI